MREMNRERCERDRRTHKEKKVGEREEREGRYGREMKAGEREVRESLEREVG